MNIEAENLDSLRKLVRELQEENAYLKEKLKKANIAYPESNVFEDKMEDTAEYDPDQGERIIDKFITEDMANKYFAMFWGRTDVYAKRGKNGGYFPQCDNRWNDRLCPKQRGEKIRCEDCENTKWTKLTAKKIVEHLVGYKEDGSDVLGVYPLLPDGTCRFIVFDFDNHEKGAEATDFANVTEEWHKEVDALRMMCEKNGITPLIERSRSGKGAHVWIFFKRPISASLARNFGFLLLDKGQSSINMKSFQYYDRMYPCQDVSSSIGNLIALPLQGQALKNGNSAFVDRNWNAYPDQWDILLNHTTKLSIEDIEYFMQKWKAEISETIGVSSAEVVDRPKPWKKKQSFFKSDVIGKMHIVLGDGVYVDELNLMPRIQNQIRSLAAFDNPIFYKNKRLGYSNYYNFSAIYMGQDIDGYIRIPRGLRDTLISNCKEAGIEYDLVDHREKGRPIRVTFNGDLRTGQDLAADRMLQYDHGVLSATTAFGKTVVCSYLIAQRKVFENMYAKRLRTYKRLGYSLISNMVLEKQTANAIYDSGNYSDIFEQDLVEAEKRIIISSPQITQDKIDRMIYVTRQRVEVGCKITVITINPETEVIPLHIAAVNYELTEDISVMNMKDTEKKEELLPDEDIALIALVTMAEAEGECEEGKRLVIDTILNRMDSEHFPDTAYDVIYQPYQFSSMWNGRVDCCEVREDICQLVREELECRTNYDVVFFTAGCYSNYGVPMFQVENHYFSRYE